jgi:putative alpha-1,2-mannosidase
MISRPLHGAWFRHGAIADGGLLQIEMSEEPDLSFASDAADAPPSMSKLVPAKA